jgi:glycosyltransferase involved in cell wall biosynthesis
MKILQIIPFFTPVLGGSVDSAYNLSKYLAKKGHDVTIFTTDFKADEDYIKSLEEIRVVPFHCIANIGMMLFSPKMKKQLKGEINNFDIIHMHNFRSYQNSIVYHYAKKYEVPYILQAHGDIPRIFGKKQLKKIYDYIWGNKLLNDANGLIASNNIEIKQYQNIGLDENKIWIVPNGIDISYYSQIPKKGEFRKKYSINEDEKIILYLGRIHKIKGIDLLIDTFADLIDKFANVKLVIVGPDDGFLQVLEKQVRNLDIDGKVIFTGPLFNRDKLEAYVDADVFVLPSRYETFGVCVLEACICGAPVIVAENCGIANLIEDKVGFVVKFDKRQLKHAILKIFDNENMRKKFEKNCKNFVKERFDWEKIVNRFEEVYSILK